MPAEVDLSSARIADLAACMEHGMLSSEHLVQLCLERISMYDPMLGAFANVFVDAAVRLAAIRDEERRQGQSRGPLHGIPIVFKDIAEIEGFPTTAGSRLFDGYIAESTATVVYRLDAAGMVTLGKTQMAELAFGGWGTNRMMGTPMNPWDAIRHRVPGGSSSGAAVAVAAGFAPAALGTDTGGSVRIPASLCGLVGLKTTAKKIPTDHLILLSESLDTPGPITRCVADAALLFDALSGEATIATLGRPISTSGAGFRIGILGAEDLQGADPEVVSAYRAAIDALESFGAQTEEFSFGEPMEAFVERIGVIIGYEGWRRHARLIESAPEKMNPEVLDRFRAGQAIATGDYHVAVLKRNQARIEMARRVAEFDAVLTPTTPIAAIPREDVDEGELPLSRYTRPVSYFGLCALAVPSGLNVEGLPLSVQFIGAPDSEGRILQIGHAYENARGTFPSPDLSGFESA